MSCDCLTSQMYKFICYKCYIFCRIVLDLAPTLIVRLLEVMAFMNMLKIASSISNVMVEFLKFILVILVKFISKSLSILVLIMKILYYNSNYNSKLGLYYRQSNIQCDYPARVDCGDRPVCDNNDENCHDWHITTTTKKPSPCDGIECDHGNDYYPEGNQINAKNKFSMRLLMIGTVKILQCTIPP